MIQVHHGHQISDERDLEPDAAPLDHETVLGGPELDVNDHSAARSNHEAHQVSGPVLVLGQGSTIRDEDVLTSNRLSALTIEDLAERDLMALGTTSQGSNREGTVGDVDGGAGLEIAEVPRVDIETEETLETMRLPEMGDLDPGTFSRGTRLQR